MISAALTDELSNLAAIVYRPEDDADSLLREFATALIHKGHQIGGLVQRNEKDGREQHAAMVLIDLMTGCVCPISQAGRDCKLDPGALANAALAIGRALDAGVELVIVNKFSTQEAAGKGLRNELATAVATGLPVLTAVPEKHFGAWQAFSGGFGTTMACERTLIDD
jgi:molybdate transport system ATP-binding protein